MMPVILVIHVLLAAALIVIVLLQKSEGGGLGFGGGGMSGFMTGRSQANLLTRTTAILAAAFMGTSLLLGWMATQRHEGGTILEKTQAESAPISAPATTGTPTPVDPASKAAGPVVPPAAGAQPQAPAQNSAPAPSAPAIPGVPLAK